MTLTASHLPVWRLGAAVTVCRAARRRGGGRNVRITLQRPLRPSCAQACTQQLPGYRATGLQDYRTDASESWLVEVSPALNQLYYCTLLCVYYTCACNSPTLCYHSGMLVSAAYVFSRRPCTLENIRPRVLASAPPRSWASVVSPSSSRSSAISSENTVSGLQLPRDDLTLHELRPLKAECKSRSGVSAVGAAALRDEDQVAVLAVADSENLLCCGVERPCGLVSSACGT